ncbi:MAG: hypothetical protein HRT61_07670 [Ekhidna sp.]|nr:hypothetical protein [Ekhidna sp.]
MKIEANKVKKWCDEALSPVAWQRIVVKVSPELRGTGLNIKNLTDPSDSILLDDGQYDIIKKAIEEVYDVPVEVKV